MTDTGSIALLAFDENAIQAVLYPARSLFSTATRYSAFSRLSILSFQSARAKLCQKTLNKVLELVETLTRKSLCMRKYCSSQFTAYDILQYSASSHSSSDMLCGSSGFRARCQFSLQPLHQSGNMPLPGVACFHSEVFCFMTLWVLHAVSWWVPQQLLLQIIWRRPLDRKALAAWRGLMKVCFVLFFA